MTQKPKGNLRGLAPSQLKQIQRLFKRKIPSDELISFDVAQELLGVASDLGRLIGLLVSREGRIEEVLVGTREIIYIPDLGRYRFSKGRLRRLRLITVDLSKSDNDAVLTSDIYADLEKLRLDLVLAIKRHPNRISVNYAHLTPTVDFEEAPVETQTQRDLGRLSLDFNNFIIELENQLDRSMLTKIASDKPGAFLVGVYDPRAESSPEANMAELSALARTAGLEILGQTIQRRKPDPRTVLGKGKLEELVLQCLRAGAGTIVFDTELKPFQWRVITNSTELKVLDRSMIILDIFAQRAKSRDGRLQVELAQLRYNLPRLVEKDEGLSRLTGGIGGRGPGETKLEIGRRRARDRINELSKRIKKLSKQRSLQRSRRKDRKIPLVSIVGYTNAGKSTLFNALTSGSVLVEDKLFATLEPAQRRMVLPFKSEDDEAVAEAISKYPFGKELILSDTVGFIRDLPEELFSAFKATLEELYEASLLIHVLDAADPEIEKRKVAVERILSEMDLLNTPQILVLNKIDRLSPEELEKLKNDLDGLPISAQNGIALEELKEELNKRLQGRD